MEAVILVYCPSCGTATAPSDRYCANCGAPAVLPPGYVPYVPMAPPPQNRTAMIVVIVILVVVVATIGTSALLYVMVSGLIQGPSFQPIGVGMTVSRSTDGTNWTITFTSVPSNFNPSVAEFSLSTQSGVQALPDTPLSSLGGGMVSLSNGLGSLYVRYRGSTSGSVIAGDTISVGAMTSLGSTTTGYQARLIFAAGIVWSGTLQ